MFAHNFKYSLKTLLKNKFLLFWTLAFPLILGTFFKMAFQDIENNEKLEIINIAIVDDDSFNNSKIYQESFQTLSDENSADQLFNIVYVSEKEAQDLLNDKKITGFLKIEEEPRIVVNKSGINETIFQFAVNKIHEQEILFNNYLNQKIQVDPHANVELIIAEAQNILNDYEVNIKDISNNNLSYTMIEFYTLIAMTCLYGGILGMTAINQNLANMSNKGKRISISPTSKWITILSSVLASFLVQLFGLLLLFLYTIFILDVDYGSNIFLSIILAIIGSLAGLSMGIAISTVFKTNESTKISILISLTMLGCFLSGMMGITMKYIIDKNIPIINIINPANMITDGFYSLYYYTTYERFCFNIISLIIFSLLMIFIAIFSLRRQKYDSI